MTGDAERYIRLLGMEPHPEGGYFRETLLARESVPFRGEEQKLYSSIYFLLREGERSHLHRIHCDEVWYFHDGAPLCIYMLSPEGKLSRKVLGLDPEQSQQPQILVPAGTWFGASMEGGGFALVGCMCAPCFRYDRFELMHRAQLEEEFPQHVRQLADLVLA